MLIAMPAEGLRESALTPPVRAVPGGAAGRRLFLLSFLMLFVELALIRWTSANVVYLAYFSNFVLLASFLGIGLGFLAGRRGLVDLRFAPVLILAAVAFVWVFPISLTSSSGTSYTGLLGGPPLPMWVTLPVIFLLSTGAMAAIGQGVAETFATFPPLRAYRLDIGGSLGGIVAFSVLAFLEAPPLVWGLVIVGILGFLLGGSIRRTHLLALAGLLAVLGVASFLPGEHWSPYYKVTATSHSDGTVSVDVNGIPHQTMVPLSMIPTDDPHYLQPYEHLRHSPGRVLIIGAGTGDDVAVALHEGATHVDAVEIDPVIHGLGVTLNPDHPYQSPRVTSYINDGRAFLQGTDRRYNLIVFALPDSLTLVNGSSQLRLESYLFTLNAMREVRDHLAPNGVFTLYNYYKPFVAERFGQTIADAFGHAPCLDVGSRKLGTRSMAVFTVGLRPSAITCSTYWSAPAGADPTVATDNWPFPYLPHPEIPRLYAVSLALILAFAFFAVRWAGRGFGRMTPYADLFCMGAAFMLLETKNVVQFALLFGTTWFVNSLVFCGILLAVLGAIEVARRVEIPRVPLYLLLGASLALAWAVPPDRLLGLPSVPRFAAAVAIAFAPVFLANLVFAQRFKESAHLTVAFGANLLGAMVGGVLEYGALLVGYRSLLVVVMILYGASFVLMPRAGSARSVDVGVA